MQRAVVVVWVAEKRKKYNVECQQSLRSVVGPVKISRKYMELQSAAISIFYGK
jgi:hypothetical protein